MQNSQSGCCPLPAEQPVWVLHKHRPCHLVPVPFCAWPRDRPRSPTWQANSLPAEPHGKPKNTGVGSLSLLQGIFLAQELNWGLLHCRRILYQLSRQGTPMHLIAKFRLKLKKVRKTTRQFRYDSNPLQLYSGSEKQIQGIISDEQRAWRTMDGGL